MLNYVLEGPENAPVILFSNSDRKSTRLNSSHT